MKYFDYVKNASVLEDGLANLLGFGKILSPKDSLIVISEPNNLGQSEHGVILEGRPRYLMKYINDKRVIGIIINNFESDKNLIEHAKHKEKLLIINARDLTACGERESARNISRAKELMKNALHSKVTIAIISGAQRDEELLSAQQLFELAKMLGASDQQAKSMLTKVKA